MYFQLKATLQINNNVEFSRIELKKGLNARVFFSSAGSLDFTKCPKIVIFSLNQHYK